MQSMTLDLGRPVHTVDYGGHGPAMVLVHGLGGSHADWSQVGPPLAQRFHVVAPDLAGFGRTPGRGHEVSVLSNAALLDRFISAVTEPPVVLMGNSMGGLISMIEASQHPERIARLVLLDPAVPHPRGAPIDREVLRLTAAYGLPLIGVRMMRRHLRTLGSEGLVRRALELCCVDASRVDPGAVRAIVALMREREAMEWAIPAGRAAARSLTAVLLRRRRFRRIVLEIRVPVLLVHGDHDRLVSPRAAHELAALRPDWTLRMLDDVGHVPQLEVPERLLSVLGEWLDQPASADHHLPLEAAG